MLFGDFLIEQAYQPPRHEASVLIYAHCYQKSFFGTAAEQIFLGRIGASFKVLDSGCCGLAGAFGFHPEHSEIADAIGEQFLFPALREAAEDSIVLTNGFRDPARYQA